MSKGFTLRVYGAFGGQVDHMVGRERANDQFKSAEVIITATPLKTDVVAAASGAPTLIAIDGLKPKTGEVRRKFTHALLDGFGNLKPVLGVKPLQFFLGKRLGTSFLRLDLFAFRSSLDCLFQSILKVGHQLFFRRLFLLVELNQIGKRSERFFSFGHFL